MQTKAQKQTLATMRGILRHIRKTMNIQTPVNSAGRASFQYDVSLLTSYIKDEFRNNQSVKNRSEAKKLREKATNVLTYLQAVEHQKELINIFRGVDPDKQDQRAAVAKYVGLEIPSGIPLDVQTSTDFAGKYAMSLAARSVDISKLKGIDNLKAQYYGVDAVIEEKVGKKVLDIAKAAAAKNDLE